MEPFRILCETCRSRLKIRSPEVIGEIHACPKCGSMVHILPPAGWQPNTAASSASQFAATSESALALSAGSSLVIPASLVAEFSMPADAAEAHATGEPAPVPPPARSSSPLAYWAAGGVAALVAVGVTLILWLGSGNKPDHPTTTPAAEKPTDLAQQPARPPAAPASAPAQTAAPDQHKDAAPQTTPARTPANPSAASAKVATAAVVPQPSPAQSPSKTSVENTKPVTSPKATEIAASKPPVSAPAPPKTAEPAAKNNDHAPVLKFDPLDFDPERLGSIAKAPANPNPSTNSIPAVASNDDAALAGVGPPAKDLAAPIAAPAAANPTITVRRGQPGDIARRVAAQSLATRVKALQVTDMPVSRLIETLSALGGIGITLDPVALELVGASPRTTVSANAQDATIQTLLRDVLTPLHLELVEQGEQVRVALPHPDVQRAIDYDVKDLVHGRDAVAVAELIKRFIAPSTWKETGGAGILHASGTSLRIEQSDAVRRQIVIFCERLRLARGIVLRSKYPADLVSVDSPYKSLAAKLAGHTTFTFLPWTRFSEVIQRWQQLSGLTILVDWASLAELELSPASPVACSAVERTWEESLDGILQPLGLGWWAVDANTIQITSLNGLRKNERVEFYSVPTELRQKFATGAALADSLQEQLAKRFGEKGKEAPIRMEFDEPSGRLIVLAPPSAHRYLSQHLSAATK